MRVGWCSSDPHKVGQPGSIPGPATYVRCQCCKARYGFTQPDYLKIGQRMRDDNLALSALELARACLLVKHEQELTRLDRQIAEVKLRLEKVKLDQPCGFPDFRGYGIPGH